MDKGGASKTYKLGDRSSSDIIVRLRNREGRPEWIYCHSLILKEKSKFFADQLSRLESTNCIEVQCSESDYDHHVKLLKLLYLRADHLLLDSWDSIRTAVGVLQAAVSLCCEEISQSCIRYLEAVPWEDKEEEEILKAVSGLGSLAMPICTYGCRNLKHLLKSKSNNSLFLSLKKTTFFSSNSVNPKNSP